MELKEKILQAIEQCVHLEDCNGCPYNCDGKYSECIDALLLDVKTYIKNEE